MRLCRVLPARRMSVRVSICWMRPDSGDDYIGIVVMVVIPGTPAAEAGLVRGDFITAVNGEEVTESNYQSLGRAVYDGAVDVTVNSVTWTDNGTTPVLTPKGNVQLGSATFTSPGYLYG